MSTEFGVYLHVPFCADRCDYCAFATWTDRHHLIDEYMAAMLTQTRRAVAAGFGTDYVGLRWRRDTVNRPRRDANGCHR